MHPRTHARTHQSFPTQALSDAPPSADSIGAFLSDRPIAAGLADLRVSRSPSTVCPHVSCCTCMSPPLYSTTRGWYLQVVERPLRHTSTGSQLWNHCLLFNHTCHLCWQSKSVCVLIVLIIAWIFPPDLFPFDLVLISRRDVLRCCDGLCFLPPG